MQREMFPSNPSLEAYHASTKDLFYNPAIGDHRFQNWSMEGKGTHGK